MERKGRDDQLKRVGRERQLLRVDEVEIGFEDGAYPGREFWPSADLLRKETAAAEREHARERTRDGFEAIGQVRSHALMQKRRVAERRACAALALTHKPWLEWTQLGIAHGFILSRGRRVPETRRDLAPVGPDLA